MLIKEKKYFMVDSLIDMSNGKVYYKKHGLERIKDYKILNMDTLNRFYIFLLEHQL